MSDSAEQITADMTPMLRELTAVIGLPPTAPRRQAAVAAKTALLTRITQWEECSHPSRIYSRGGMECPTCGLTTPEKDKP